MGHYFQADEPWVLIFQYVPVLIFRRPAQSALHAAIVMHGAMFISNTLPGLFYLWLDKTPIFTMLKGIKDANGNLR